MGGQGAGGGGMSRYEPRPSYQPSILDWPTAQPCGLLPRSPDISANAGIGMVIYANGGWTAVGGTSASSPLMSGLVADADSGCGRVGVLTPLLYALYSEGSYGGAFTDVTSGNTDLTGSNGGAYPATTGYDAATGIGTPIAAGLTCTSVSAVSSGYEGGSATVSGLGLEHATIDFGSAQATIVSANATSAEVIVPAGSGTVTCQRPVSAAPSPTPRSSPTETRHHRRRLRRQHRQPAARLLAGGIRRRNLHLWLRTVLRLDGLAATPEARRRHRPDPEPERLLARRLRRWDLRFR